MKLRVIVLFGLLICVCCSAFACNSTKKEEKDDGKCNVHFNLCTDLEVLNIRDKVVDKGDYIKQPSVTVVGDNPLNMVVTDWYLDSNYNTVWDFIMNPVERDLELYAKWERSHAITYHFNKPNQEGTYTEATNVTYVLDGEKAPRRDSLAYGYKCDGYYTDTEFNNAFDFSQPIKNNIDLYMKPDVSLGKSLYVDGNVLNRISFIESVKGSQDNTSKTVITNEEESYLKVNYGSKLDNKENYVGLRFNLDNYQVYLNESQHLLLRVKNFGNADKISVYASIFKYTNEWAILGEDIKFIYNMTPEQKMMTDSDEWITLTMKFDDITFHDKTGISDWASAIKIGDFRIECKPSDDTIKYYNEHPGESFQNVLAIKDMQGEYCADYLEDSVIPCDDNELAIQSISNSQTVVSNGWTLPKENDKVFASDNFKTYKKENGILTYIPLGDNAPTFAQKGNLVFKGKDIDVSLFSFASLYIYYCNYGYTNIESVSFKILDANNNTVNKTIKITDSISKHMTDGCKELSINIYDCLTTDDNGARINHDKITGIIKEVSLNLSSLGVNNQILFNSVIVKENVPNDIAGINFMSPLCGKVDSVDGCSLEYDSDSSSTKVNVVREDAKITKNYNYNIDAYSKLELCIKTSSITKAIVSYTIDANEYDIEFVLQSGSFKTYTQDLIASGDISSINITFEGTGDAYIQYVKFVIDGTTGVDLSSNTYLNKMGKDWIANTTFEYDEKTSSTNIGDMPSGSSLRLYLSDKLMGVPEIKAGEDKKLYIVYQNTSDRQKLIFNLRYAKSDTTYGFDGTNQVNKELIIENSMAENEWACFEISLTELSSSVLWNDMNIVRLGFSQSTAPVKIRAIVIK